jgi:hypothetical protein
MLANRRNGKRRRTGSAYLLTLILITLFATLAVSMTGRAMLNLRQASNQAKAMEARFAAESGLEFAMWAMTGVEVAGTSDPGLINRVYDHLSAKLDGTGNLGQQLVTQNGSVVTVPAIDLPQGESFAVTVTQLDDSTLQLRATGASGQITRQVGLQFHIQDDTTVLHYAVASRPRLIARGNITVEGDLCSTWDQPYDAAPLDIQLGSGASVTGGVKTVLSSEQWEEADCDDYVDEDLEVSYDEPSIGEYETSDFDTSSYRDLASNSLPPPDYEQWEGFPEGNPSKWFKRDFHVGSEAEPKVMNNVTIGGDDNAHFKNCTFTGYTYVEVPNNVVFEDCTFEGPVITDVPSDFQWTTNAMYFKGNTNITNEIMPESTILAPNFNVNIGDFSKEGEQSNSKITGILVGGIVDIRDNAVIEGTILSMADLSHIPSGSVHLYGTNLGYWEGDAEESGGSVPDTYNIHIIPQPGNMLPYGMTPKYSIQPVAGSYEEPL